MDLAEHVLLFGEQANNVLLLHYPIDRLVELLIGQVQKI